MTTTDANASASTPAAPRRRAIVWIAAAGVLVGAAAVAWYGFHLQWRFWCHAANKGEYAKKLLEENDPALFPIMEGVMRDADQPDGVRVALAALLLQKSRPGPVEAALKDPRLDVRAVALEALAHTPYFKKQYVQNESYGVRETLRAWLADPNASSREIALSILPGVYEGKAQVPDEVTKLVRGMLALPPKGPSQPLTRAAAAMAVAGWEDCAAAADLLALVRSEPDPFAKMREMQALARLYDLPSGACKSEIAEADLLAVVDAALAHPGDDGVNRAVRMASLQLLEGHPAWAPPRIERIRAILDSNANPVERRIALEALASARDPKTVGELPRWLFDPSSSLRSSAAGSAFPKRSGVTPLAYEALLVGYVSNETAKDVEGMFRIRVAELRQKAGAWVGLPRDLLHKGGSLGEVTEPLNKLYRDGVYEGVTRQAFADDWYRWLLTRAKLTGPDADAAFAAHASFWLKAKSGDVAGAKAIYDAGAATHHDLWEYERGWLLAHS